MWKADSKTLKADAAKTSEVVVINLIYLKISSSNFQIFNADDPTFSPADLSKR